MYLLFKDNLKICERVRKTLIPNRIDVGSRSKTLKAYYF